MPQIGDLLAQISGGQPSPNSKPTSSSGIKRKAEDDAGSISSNKITKARQPDSFESSGKTSRYAQSDVTERSYSTGRPVKSSFSATASSAKPAVLPHRTNSPATNGRYVPPAPAGQRDPSSSNGRPPQAKKTQNSAGRPTLSSAPASTSKVPSARPSPTTPTTSEPSRAPKKGSFAEIMARAAKAQQTMGKVGMIQHKAIDKTRASKERETPKPEQKSSINGKTGKPYAGSAKPAIGSTRGGGRIGASSRDGTRENTPRNGKAPGRTKPAVEDPPEKKVKKSATATTGYTGTARPRPGATKSSSSRNDQRSRPPRAGGLLAPPRPRGRDRYEEDYDEDMDDFIDYDDEEEDVGPGQRGYGYEYDSAASSDMEAGMSDIDDEERRAERVAFEEDKREKALEEKLKREKEERKRRWAQSGR